MPYQSAFFITVSNWIHPFVDGFRFGWAAVESEGRMSRPSVRRVERATPNYEPAASHVPNMLRIEPFIFKLYLCKCYYCHLPHNSMKRYKSMRHDLAVGLYP